MKKYFLISMALFAMLFTNCKKDDDSSTDSGDNGGDDSTTYQELPVPVTLTETSNAAYIFNQSSLFEALSSSTKNTNATATTTVDYDKRVILKKTVDDDGDITVQDYYYKNAEEGVLDSIVYSSQGTPYGTIIYTTDNDDKISKIEIVQADRSLMAKYEYTYNGDKVATYSWFANFSDGTQIDASGNVSYNGDNVSGYVLTGTYDGSPITLTYQYTYDNKNYVNLNVTTQEDGFTYTHNVTNQQLTIDYMGGQYPFQTTYNYSYNSDNYPITVNTTDSSGTTTNGTITYEDK